jgi:SAM-dependent methyltransferase
MFTIRNCCPACTGSRLVALHALEPGDPDLAAFMAAYYTAVTPERHCEVAHNWRFVIDECQDCGLVFQRSIPDEALSSELYGRWLGRNDPLAPSKPPMSMEYYTYMAQEIMQIVAFLQRRVGRERRLRFLDYGMGWGNWSQMAKAFGVDAYGVELSPTKAEHARGLGLLVLANDEVRSQRFDFISTEQVVEHLPQPRESVLELIECLAPGGVLKISVPDGGRIKTTLRSWKWRYAMARRNEIMPVQPLEHLNCFNSDSLSRFALGCGLRPVDFPIALAYAYSTDWSTPRATAKNVLRPLKRFVTRKGCYALFERT